MCYQSLRLPTDSPHSIRHVHLFLEKNSSGWPSDPPTVFEGPLVRRAHQNWNFCSSTINKY